MKKMNKLAGLILTLAMALTLAVPAMAKEADMSGHTYKAYQIFSGTQAENVSQLGNIVWGSGINGAAFLTALKADSAFVVDEKNVFADCATAADVADAMTGWGDSSDQAKAFAKIAYDNKAGSGVDCVAGTTSLDAGYYLVVDVTEFGTGATDTVYNLALLQLTNKGTFEIAVKTDIPQVEKKVKDANDTEGSTTNWQDSADYDIGDNVPFQLKATLGGKVSEFDSYEIVFHDTLSSGLKYNGDAKVYIDGDEVAGFTVTYVGNTLTVSCDDVKALGATNNSVITVEYTAELTEGAVIGSAGNPNKVYLEYSNNPNDEGTGKTQEDKVIVFTYKVIVNKVDENKQPLVGAGFTLYKKVGSAWVPVGDQVIGDTMTAFIWKGLDDGDYKLEETTTPAGYNTIDPIEFTVTATHDIESDNPALTALSGNLLSGEAAFTADSAAGTLTTDVVNQSGTVLPETGGIGTTIFYALGAALMVGAGVLLVTKKRMGE